MDDLQVERFTWRTARAPTANPRNVVTNLLRQYVHLHCARRGLRFGGPHDADPYFPAEIGKDGYIPYKTATGRKSRIRVAGVRTFRRIAGDREEVHYRLRLFLRPTVYLFENPCILIHVGLLLMDAKGQPLPHLVAFRRERTVRKSWRNDAWLSRTLAVADWLCGGETEINLALTPTCRLALAATVSSFSVPVGYDEEHLGPIEEDEDAELADEPETGEEAIADV